MFDTTAFLDAALVPGMAIAVLAGILSFLSPCVLPVMTTVCVANARTPVLIWPTRGLQNTHSDPLCRPGPAADRGLDVTVVGKAVGSNPALGGAT